MAVLLSMFATLSAKSCMRTCPLPCQPERVISDAEVWLRDDPRPATPSSSALDQLVSACFADGAWLHDSPRLCLPLPIESCRWAYPLRPSSCRIMMQLGCEAASVSHSVLIVIILVHTLFAEADGLQSRV